MSGSKLQVLEEAPSLSKKALYIAQTEQRCSTAWHERERESALDRERIRRTANLLSEYPLKGKIADLGCGSAPFLPYLDGAEVTVVDSAQAALDEAPSSAIKQRGALPYCLLEEEAFDGVLFTDVIAEIDPHLHRLTLSEISALMKREAYLVCSTELDYRTEQPLEHFLALLGTEFRVEKCVKSAHRLYTVLRSMFDAPSKFYRAARDEAYRRREIEERRGFFRLWFFLNSLQGVGNLWRLFRFLEKRAHNRHLVLFLERFSKVLWGEAAVTHVILVLKKKNVDWR